MDKVARLRIDLDEMPRLVWRRVEVPTEIHLSDLHLVIQAAMGWENYHLYHFRIGYGVFYSELDPDFALGEENSASDTTLAELCKRLPRNMKFGYTYDFGDDWEHTIKVESINPADPEAVYPRLLKVVRRCPPEDCGGPWGYAEYLKAISDPNHEEHKEFLEWGDPDFDPEVVDTRELETAVERVAAYLHLPKRKSRKPAG